MNHFGTISLNTNRLTLRKFKSSDIKEAYENWTSDNKVTTFLTWETHSSEEVTKNIISNWINSYDNNNFYQWAIILKDENINIGTISIVELDESLQSVTIGYCIGSKWWNQGIVSEAFKEVIEFLFKEVKVNKIISSHDVENPNSGKVMLKCGLKYEGTFKDGGINIKGIRDISLYGLVKREYKI